MPLSPREARRAACYLVRHGQSEWNVLELTQGQADAPGLTALGREQAVAAGRLIAADLGAGVGVDVVRTSDLRRAGETAEILVAGLGGRLVVDPRLREAHLGSLEGRPYADSWVAAETHDWSDPHLPVAGGESPHQVQQRMAAALADVEPTAVTVLVSHGDALRPLLAHLAGHPLHEAPWVAVPNGAVLRLDGSVVTRLGASDG